MPSPAGRVGQDVWRRLPLCELILRVFLLGTSQTTGGGVAREERAEGLGCWKQRRGAQGGGPTWWLPGPEELTDLEETGSTLHCRQAQPAQGVLGHTWGRRGLWVSHWPCHSWGVSYVRLYGVVHG